MTTRLNLYNSALLYCSEPPLASLEDETVARRVLDAVWDDGAVDKILAEGLWNNALRARSLAADPELAPAFGQAHAFRQPDDFVRLAAIALDPHMNQPLTGYLEEAGYWFADAEPVYVSYVSNDGAYGGDLSRWPPALAEAAARWIASVAAHGFNKAETQIQRMEQSAREAFVIARGRDAAQQATRFLPSGRWLRARSRRNGWGGRATCV